jgi:hypothetical protein
MHVIEFSDDGTAETLHTDGLPLGELGTLAMERASSIEWNEHFQFWEVHIGDKVPFGDPSRAVCLAWEVDHFNSLILHR